MKAPSARSRRLSSLASMLIFGFVSAPGFGVAGPAGGAALKRLGEVLAGDKTEPLRLTWTSGAPGAAPFRRLRIESGRAALERCADSCQLLGASLELSPGERAQLLSGLRAASLGSLRDSELAAAADRQLELAVAGASVGEWRLPRSDWPAPPGGYGLADFLDDFAQRIERTATARPLVPIPATVAELRAVRLQLRVQPRVRPGGLLVIEQGRLRITPEEGSLARVPRPRPLERPLSAEEEERLLGAISAARLEALDGLVEKRAQPAIGDDDGRVATLHLFLEGAAFGQYQPRGYERYVADLLRSPAAPLLQQLLGWLVTNFAEGKAGAPPRPSGPAAARRGR